MTMNYLCKTSMYRSKCCKIQKNQKIYNIDKFKTVNEPGVGNSKRDWRINDSFWLMRQPSPHVPDIMPRPHDLTKTF